MSEMAKAELKRFLRHMLVPFVTYAVSQGWLPEGSNESVIEAGVIFLSFVVVYGWSLRNEVKGRVNGTD